MIEPNAHLKSIQRDRDIIGDRSEWICLDRNERVSPFPSNLLDELLSGITSWDLSGYPDYGPLYERLARLAGYPLSQIALGAGSDALIRRLFQAFLDVGDIVVTPDPTYAMYAVWSRVFRAQMRTQPYGVDRRLDLDALLGLIEQGARLVAIANPDQPTGAALGLKEMERIAQAASKVGALLLIDEAYYPFFEETALPLLRGYANVVILRTFSKAWGIAGLRVGYAVGAPSVVEALHTVRSPGEVSSVSAIVAARLLDRPQVMSDYRAETEAGRALLNGAAAQLGFEPLLTRGNFQLIRLPPELPSDAVALSLKRRGYLIKHGFGAEALRNCIRVTLDSPAIIRPFVTVLHGAISDLREQR